MILLFKLFLLSGWNIPSIYSTTLAPTTGPTTTFQGQNFNISDPSVLFVDNNGDFGLRFSYEIGQSATNTKFTLFQTNCTISDSVSDVLTPAGPTMASLESDYLNVTVGVNKTKFNDSPLVETEGGDKGNSKGVLRFCAKAEALLANTSVSFSKTNIELSFDLTTNSFEVLNNGIKANDIGQSNTTVDSEYKIDAFQCGPSDFKEVPAGSKTYRQGGVIGICLKPNDDSKNAVDISNFEMYFTQNSVEKLKVAKYGTDGPEPVNSALSAISSEDQTKRVSARLITTLFSGEVTSEFNVTGNVYFKFRTSTRDLSSPKSHNLRQMEDNLEGSAGETPFSLSVEIEKAGANGEENKSSSFMFGLFGSALTVTIGFILYKKLA